ncbi:MAG: ribose-phosphate pyrophosphokinase [Candidatus Micrarchaeota archaeon]
MLDMVLLTGNSNSKLAESIASHLNTKLVPCTVGRFADGEIRLDIEESLRGKHVFVIQSVCNSSLPDGKPTSVNDNLMELLVLLDAVKRDNAEKISAVMPYLAYTRQDRKVKPREPITAKLVLNLIAGPHSGVHDLLSVDLHAPQIEGFVDCYFGNITVSQLVPSQLKKIGFDKDVIVVSPDSGGANRAKRLADRLSGDMAIVHKYRSKPNSFENASVLHVVGDVEGKNALLYDDMVDTGGSLVHAAEALLDRGAKKVAAFATHAVLSGDAIEKIEDSPLEKMLVTDTIPLKKQSRKIDVVSVAPTIATVMDKVYKGESVSALFK